jgi:hypothetical protein
MPAGVGVNARPRISALPSAAGRVASRADGVGVGIKQHVLAPFGWNYKPAEKHGWLIFGERKILFRLKKQAE